MTPECAKAYEKFLSHLKDRDSFSGKVGKRAFEEGWDAREEINDRIDAMRLSVPVKGSGCYV